MIIRTVFLLLICPVLSLGQFAVHGQGTRADYDRAASLRERTQNRVFRERFEPQWIEGSGNFWYRVEYAKSQFEYVFVDVDAGQRRLAFDHERLAKAISVATDPQSPESPNAEISLLAKKLPIRNVQFDAEGKQLQFRSFDSNWQCDLSTYALTRQDDQDASDDGNDSLTSLTRIERSGDNGEETWVRFINQMQEPIELFWVDGGGSRKSYGKLAAGEDREQHTFAGHVWLATTGSGKPVAVFRATEQRRDAVIDGSAKIESSRRRRNGTDAGKSPDGKWQAFIRDANLFVRELSSEAESQLTQDGVADDPYLARFYWSPDSKKLVAIQQSVGQRREVHLIESSPSDQLQPKLHTMVYAKPGDELPLMKPRLFHLETKKRVDISSDLFANPWRISRVTWQPDSSRFRFLYNQRGHQVLRIMVVDADTGEAAALVNEESETFIDYAHKQFHTYLEETHEIIWMSERDGWNHLYLFDGRTGAVKHQITKGEWVVRGVERVDAEQRRIWFRASGVYPEQDPYFIHYGFVDFDGSNLTFLTTGNGTHKIEYSPDGDSFVDTYSRVDLPPVSELRRSDDGSLICELERADWSELLQTGWQTPERFVAKGRDGKTDIHGVIYRPTNFDPQRQYPVIEKIYAGPHGSFVPKSFAAYRRAQTYAELGFIVVQIDGMGTSNRSKAFHDVCWKNLGDSGFPDRILWMQSAAQKYPYLNLNQVGIFGGSAGGQSTLRALLAHGEFYKVGVADCGCHDNRMDKVWWNELWMGWPIGPHYEEQSNTTQAHRLTGKLLLTVGELDRNVDPASTMQVVNALIKADKDFDFLIVPGAGHGVGESPYANRRRQDFFVRHLLGVEPRR